MKLTTAQLWLVHTLETLFFGAIVTGGISVYQAIGTGNYDASALAAIFIPAVIAVLAKGSSAVISNNNLIQAGEDTLNQLTASHQALTATIARSIVVQQVPVASPQPVQTAAPMQSSIVPGVTLTPTPPNSGTITTGFQSPEGTSTTSFVPSVPQRDAWSNSALMQAIGKPPQPQQ